jgi:hypothetical protein
MCEKSQILTSNIFIYRLILIIFLILSVSYTLVLADDNTSLKDRIAKDLICGGFENIRIKINEKQTVVAYENRVFRFDIDALKEVLRIIIPKLNDTKVLILVPQNRKIPIVLFETEVAVCKDYLSLKITDKEFADKLKIDFLVDDIWNEMEKETEYNSASLKFDVTVRPSVKFQFGVYTEPVMYQLNLVPGLHTTFWKGFSIDYEHTFPLHNDLLSREDSVRTELVVINQTFRLPGSFFVSTSTGYFQGQRYGIDIEAKKFFLNGNLNFGFNVGCTSLAYFEGTKLFYSDEFTVTGSVSSEIRVPELDVTLGVMAGRFLSGDTSIRFDINREFKEIQIGFFALKSTKGISNGGINIIVPIFPAKYFCPSTVRIRPADNFGLGYIVKSNGSDLIGLRYNTGYRIDSFLKQLNPDFIKNNFGK